MTHERMFEKPEWMAGPRLGHLEAADADAGSVTSGLGRFYRFAPHFAADLTFQYARMTLEDLLTNAYQYSVQGSLLCLPFPEWPLEPYLLAGPGWYYTTVHPHDDLRNDTQNHCGAHVGAGLLLAMSRNFAILGEWRYAWVSRAYWQIRGLDDRDLDRWQATLGADLHF